jgi:hypothetical protein
MHDLKITISHAELTFINEVLDTYGNQDESRFDAQKKAFISIIRKMESKFTIDKYAWEKPTYHRKLNYHEAYFLMEAVRTIDINALVHHSAQPYYQALRNGIILKIHPKL